MAISAGAPMNTRANNITPLRAVVGGLLSGLVGTVSLDAVHYLKQRRAGGTQSPLRWEFAPIDTWAQAPPPGQVAKRLVEGFTQRKIPDRWAWLVSTTAHWAFGSASGIVYGILVGSLRKPLPIYGLPFGARVWASGYIVLPKAGLYKPIWEYDRNTLAWDFSAHLAYGATTGAVFWLFSKIG